ncbi:hypothetical protein [Cupriavidus basilensis]
MKKGTAAQKRTKQELFAALDTACRIYGPAREMCVYNHESFEEGAYQPNVAAKVVGLAFLGAVSAWEDFIADTYLGYLCGYPSEGGYLPEALCGQALNRTHALMLASGEANPKDAERRMRWNSPRWMKGTSRIHFKSDNPFHGITEPTVKWLEAAVVIRNRVAHNSNKAKSQFKDIANWMIGAPKGSSLLPGYSPGRLLIEHLEPYPSLHHLRDDDHFWGDIFEGYVSLWRRLADEISPGVPSSR